MPSKSKTWLVTDTETCDDKTGAPEHWIRVQAVSYTQGNETPQKGSEITVVTPSKRKAS